MGFERLTFLPGLRQAGDRRRVDRPGNGRDELHENLSRLAVPGAPYYRWSVDRPNRGKPVDWQTKDSQLGRQPGASVGRARRLNGIQARFDLSNWEMLVSLKELLFSAMPLWDADLYLQFGQERTQAALDLAARIELERPRRIVDLGCGPGNSTESVAARWPRAAITGVDVAEEMLEKGRARARMPRTLILEPTRELAAQVEESFTRYGINHKLNVALLIGGVSFGDQETKIMRGADVLIATPGRLLDFSERGKLLLTAIEILVIDEADRMLDMGFIPDIERICKLVPFTRQTLFFSATMPPEITRLTEAFLHNPVRIEVARAASTAITIAQGLVASTSGPAKRETLRRLIRGAADFKNAIIFCNRKRDVAILHKSLQKHGFNAGVLHGDMDQRARTASPTARNCASASALTPCRFPATRPPCATRPFCAAPISWASCFDWKSKRPAAWSSVPA